MAVGIIFILTQLLFSQDPKRWWLVQAARHQVVPVGRVRSAGSCLHMEVGRVQVEPPEAAAAVGRVLVIPPPAPRAARVERNKEAAVGPRLQRPRPEPFTEEVEVAAAHLQRQSLQVVSQLTAAAAAAGARP